MADRTVLAKNLVSGGASSLPTATLSNVDLERSMMLQRDRVRFKSFTSGANAALAANTNTNAASVLTVVESQWSAAVIVKDIVLTADTAKTVSDTDYVTWTVFAKYANNTNTGTVATFNTKVTGGIGNIAAFVRLNVTSSINTQLASVPLGGTLVVQAIKTAAGLDVSDVAMDVVVEAQ